MHLFIVSLLLALLAATPIYATDSIDEKRLDEVTERGTHVMPFNLEKTTHVFSRTANGGIQQVIAKDKSDTDQIQKIRDHLSEITEEFKQGDFSKPAHIHGKDMPGLAELKTANPDQIKFEYKWLPDGAQINYSTELPQLVKAIHQWFDAQLSDHAHHAVPGHEH
tara:strand:- start:189 stop:683 length:495 start_codon:yes stop_codon:yes gene_type:complete